MEILKHGEVLVVSCESCHAELKIGRVDGQSTGIGYYVKCPCCKYEIVIPTAFMEE